MELIEKLKDENFKKEFEAKVTEKSEMSMGQAICEVAKEFGIDVTEDELEKALVVNQVLDEKELAAVGGGVEWSNAVGSGNNSCSSEYCCEWLLLHPDTLRTDIDCFKNYLCSKVWEE